MRDPMALAGWTRHGAWVRIEEGTGKAGASLPLDRTALSVALGRDNTVHLALTDRAAAGRVSTLLARLNHYLGHDGVIAAGPRSEGPAAQRASEP